MVSALLLIATEAKAAGEIEQDRGCAERTGFALRDSVELFPVSVIVRTSRGLFMFSSVNTSPRPMDGTGAPTMPIGFFTYLGIAGMEGKSARPVRGGRRVGVASIFAACAGGCT